MIITLRGQEEAQTRVSTEASGAWGGIGEDKEGSEPLVEKDGGPYHISSLESVSGYRNKSSEIMHEAFAIKS